MARKPPAKRGFFEGLIGAPGKDVRKVARHVLDVENPLLKPAPKAPLKKGGQPKPAQKRTSDFIKTVAIGQAEGRLLPFEVRNPPKKKTLPSAAPYRPGEPSVPVPASKAIDRRFKLAMGSYLDPKQRKKLAQTIDPAKRRALIELDDTRQAAARQKAIDDWKPPLTPTGKLDTERVKALADAGHPAASAYLQARTGGRSIGGLIGDIATARGPTGIEAAPAIGKSALAIGEAVVQKPVEWLQTQGAGLSAAARVSAGGGVASDAPVQQAGFGFTPEDVLHGATGVAKLAAGLPLISAGMVAHPLRAAQEVIDIVRGTGQAVVMAGALLTQPQLSVAQRKALIENVVHAALKDLASRYGPNVTFKQAVQGGFDQPIIHLLDALAVAAPTIKAVGVLRLMRGGATMDDAIRLMRDPRLVEVLESTKGRGLTYKPRTAIVKGKEQADYPVELTPSRSPTGRIFQSGIDWAGERIERAVQKRGGVPGKVPFGPTKRGLRTQKRALGRDVARMQAKAAVLARDVHNYTRERGGVGGLLHRTDEVRAARLAYNLERPPDMPEEVWLRAIIADSEALLQHGPSRNVRVPSETERRLARRVQKLKLDFEDAGRNRWFERMDRIPEEQGRLAHSLIAAEKDIKGAEARKAVLQGTEHGLTPEEAARELQFTNDRLHPLRSRAKALKEQLVDLAPHPETPVDSPARTDFNNLLTQLPKVSENEREAFIHLNDSAARAYGRRTGNDPGEFYSDPESGFALHAAHLISDHTDLPEGVLAQRFGEREPYVNIAKPEAKTQKVLQQIGAETRRGESPEQATARADAAIKARDPRNATVRTSSTTIFGDLDLTGLVEIGRPTNEQWLERAIRVFRGDEKVMRDWLEWYEQAHDILLGYVGGDEIKADQLMAGFIASQANASPAGGINSVLQVLWKMQRGMEVGDKEISAAVKGIKLAVTGKPIEKGFAAKLTDFADALARRVRRTWMGGRKEGGMPAPVDVHGIRDAGYVTTKLAQRAIERGYDLYRVASRDPDTGELVRVANLPAAVKLIEKESDMPAGGVLVDSGDMADGLQYENISRFYKDKADHLNQYTNQDGSKGFLGRNDWSPAHAQALGWGAIQRFWGAEPDSIQLALDANTLRYIGTAIGKPRRTMELTQGILDGATFVHTDLQAVGNTVQWNALIPKKLKTLEVAPEQELVDKLLDEGPFTHVVSLREGEKKYRDAGNTVKLTIRGDDLVKATGALVNEIPELEWALAVPNPDGSISYLMRDIRQPNARVPKVSRKTGKTTMVLDPIRISPRKIETAMGKVRKAGYNVTHERTRAEVTVASRVQHGISADDRVLRAYAEPGGLTTGGATRRIEEPGQVRGGAPATGDARAGDTGRGRSVRSGVASSPDNRFLELTAEVDDALRGEFNAALAENERASWVTKLDEENTGGKRVAIVRDANGKIVGGGTIGNDGYMGNLFANVQGVGADIFHRLVAEGGTHLDCFDGFLPAYYAEQAGFREVARIPFDPRFAPDGWTFGEHGKPDIVYMAKVEEPAYATAGYVRDMDTAERMNQEAAQVGRVLAQTRQDGILGAIGFLNTPEGGRILYLTKEADISTLLHEMYGHGVRELKRAHPEEFAPVEDMIGRPLEEWDTEDHERFARMTESYFASGRAPTPELADAFAIFKTSMRELYGGMNKMTKLPREVKTLFDTYFGAYDDNNVFRIAAMQARLGPEDRSARAAGAFEVTDKELATLRKRNDTRAWNKSLKGVEEKFAAQVLAAEKKGGWNALEEDAQDEMVATYSHLLDLRAEAEVAKIDRENGLRKRIELLSDALTLEDDPGFEGALTSLRSLANMREDILRTVFGNEHDQVFSNRVDLLGDYLADKGLIPPGFTQEELDVAEATGTPLREGGWRKGQAAYFPHKPIGGGKLPRALNRPATPLTGTVIGQVDQAMLGLHNRNHLLRWQNGDVYADPKVVLDAWQNAQAFAFVYGLKKRLYDIARPLEMGEAANNPDAYYINFEGTPVPNLQRAVMKPGATHEVQAALEALEARDPAAVEATLTKYVGDILLTRDTLQAKLAAADDAGRARMSTSLRAIDKSVVDALFRPLQGNWGPVGTFIDYSNTIARWSLIYTNPAYIPANMIGNGLFLFSEQGPRAIVSFVQASKMALHDQELAMRIGAEGGEVPAIAGISRGRAKIPRTPIGKVVNRDTEERALRRLTAMADRWPRIASWIYEANKLGYKTREQMLELLDAPDGVSGGKLAADREIIGERTTEIMVNFTRMGDREKGFVSRLLFIWPWIRGATAWPFYYLKEYPGIVGATSQIGLATDEQRRKIMGDVPLANRDLYPLGPAKGGYVPTINTAQFSPTSTAAQSIESIIANVNAVIHLDQPPGTGSALIDYMHPIWQAGIEAATGHDNFGREVSFKDILLDQGMNFIPWGSYARQMADPSSASQVYKSRNRGALTGRKFLRGAVQQVDIIRLHQYQLANHKQTTGEKVQKKIDDLQKQVVVPVPQSVKKAIMMQQVFFDSIDKAKGEMKHRGWHPRSEGQREPVVTPLHRAQLAYALYERYLPGTVADLYRPDEVPQTKEALEAYTNDLLYGSAENNYDAILGPLQQYRAEIRQSKREAAANT